MMQDLSKVGLTERNARAYMLEAMELNQSDVINKTQQGDSKTQRKPSRKIAIKLSL